MDKFFIERVWTILIKRLLQFFFLFFSLFHQPKYLLEGVKEKAWFHLIFYALEHLKNSILIGEEDRDINIEVIVLELLVG